MTLGEFNEAFMCKSSMVLLLLYNLDYRARMFGSSFKDLFLHIDDKCQSHKEKYPLYEILLLCAVLCGLKVADIQNWLTNDPRLPITHKTCLEQTSKNVRIQNYKRGFLIRYRIIL